MLDINYIVSFIEIVNNVPGSVSVPFIFIYFLAILFMGTINSIKMYRTFINASTNSYNIRDIVKTILSIE